MDLFKYRLAVVDDALPTSADDAASSGGIRRFQQGAHRLRPGHPHERYSLVDQELFQDIQIWRDVAQVLRVEPVDDVAEGGEDAVPLGRPVVAPSGCRAWRTMSFKPVRSAICLRRFSVTAFIRISGESNTTRGRTG
ncbi:hypothetical protein ACH4FX_42465 [Streptomyces sp. NPDC018019]|uniref:hypothetical protein n=1 Tax=Streptomyces sp. NPDC018019 TaxID=3365030 RepID=UPI0037AF8B1E